MNTLQSDAFVFFGAMGDLAYKKIFPSLQAMILRGNLNVPVIGVDRSAENLDELKARARSSLEKSGKFDAEAFEKLSGLMRYVQGDITDLATFQALRKELNGAQRPYILYGDTAVDISGGRGAIGQSGLHPRRPRHPGKALRT